MAPSKDPELSETALRGCCKVCGEPEEKGRRFLICGHSLCRYKYYHIRCMRPDQIASEKQEGEQCWYCPSCLCRNCFCDMDDHEIVLCDSCDEAYHIYCLDPPRTSVPKGKWYCQFCIEARIEARTLEREARKYEQRMLQLHRKRDRAMVKSDKFEALDLLGSAAEKKLDELAAIAAAKKQTDNKEEEAIPAAKKLTLNKEETAPAAEKLTSNEEPAVIAEKLGGNDEVAATAAE